MRLILIHAKPLDELGGAELSLKAHLAAAPSTVTVDTALPDDPIPLEDYDTLILANLRPSGGLGRREEYRWASLWASRLRGYRGYAIKSERDIHPCGHRDGRCIQTDPLTRISCDCSRKIPGAFEKLYNLCDAIQFLSPLHRSAINQLVRITPLQYEIACPIDLTRFRSITPFDQRKQTALLMGDAGRVSPEAVTLAEAKGYPVERVDYLSVPYEAMPGLLNQYQAVVVAPRMLHGFGRLAVESLACGCQVITNNRVGAMSWPDPLAASQAANAAFWEMVTRRPPSPNPRRFRSMAFWRFKR
ncbi:MAG: hypothetical protein P8X55_15755 [Desulfosarcinaceae bacterium]